METEWHKLDWLADARQLIKWMHQLESGPACIVIRHSERPINLPVQETIKAELTQAGHKMAYEFGKRLPVLKSFRIYHSPSYRVQQTAERIHEGALDAGANSILEGALDTLSGAMGDLEKFVEMASTCGFSEFFNLWMDNKVPEEILEPVDAFIQRFAPSTLGKLQESRKNEIHIHVTHDLVVASTKNRLLHLECPQDLNIPFLGGYGIVLSNGALIGYADECEVMVQL
jgi:broad specificity phosphatase PhoE